MVTVDSSDGRLRRTGQRHVERTENADCVAVDKRFVDRKPRTTYRLTDRGEEHVRTLEALIDDLETDS